MVVYTIAQRFAKWTCDRLTDDADFGKKIIFSDEVHFDLDGYVNKKTRRTQNESLFGADFGPVACCSCSQKL